jgi:hypothetical protein
VLTGSVHIGGVVEGHSHPAASGERLWGGPQMVEVSRDGRRVYVTNSLYGWSDDQFYPEGVGVWLAKIDVDPDGGIVVGTDIVRRVWFNLDRVWAFALIGAGLVLLTG